jgi:hypothetical protein
MCIIHLASAQEGLPPHVVGSCLAGCQQAQQVELIQGVCQLTRRHIALKQKHSPRWWTNIKTIAVEDKGQKDKEDQRTKNTVPHKVPVCGASCMRSVIYNPCG